MQLRVIIGFKKDISDANDGMPRRKKVHTTISFLRRPKYAFVDPVLSQPKNRADLMKCVRPHF